MAQNYMFDYQHNVYDELKKKSIFEKNNQTKADYPQKTKSNKLNIKNYTRTNTFVDDVTVLDFETTGCSHLYNEVIQIGAIKYRNGKEIGRFNEFVRPSTTIPSNITQLTGITNQMVKYARPTSEVFYEFSQFLRGETLVAHNAAFDMKFLLTYLHKFQIDHEKFKVIDTVPLARRYLTQLPNHKLETIKHFLEINIESHQSINDCLVTGELYYLCKALANESFNLTLF